MAQYFTDFSEYTLGTFPNDWTARFEGYGATVIADAAFTGGVKFAWPLATNAINNNSIATWDLIDADSGRGDVEIYWRGVFGGDGNDYQQYLAARLDPNSASLNTYRLGSIDSSTVEIAKFINGSFNNVAQSNNGNTPPNELVCQRARLVGTSIKVKTWRFADPEPANWGIETTDTSLTLGSVGLFCYRKQGGLKLENDVFSVGTGGDPAPTLPLDTPPLVAYGSAVTSNTTYTANTGFTVPLGSPSVGDLAIVYVVADSGFNFTWDVPAGWVQISPVISRVITLARVIDGSESASLTINNPSSVDKGTKYIVHHITGFLGDLASDIEWSNANSNNAATVQMAQSLTVTWPSEPVLWLALADLNEGNYLLTGPDRLGGLVRGEQPSRALPGSIYSTHQVIDAQTLDPGVWTIEAYEGIRTYMLAIRGVQSGAGPNTPINLGATNILANSVRFTWEQG